MEKEQIIPEDFSLSRGGPFNRLLLKYNLYDRPRRLAFIGLCISWLPLLILSTVEGTLISGVEVPFYKDIAMHARTLVALPMLIFIKPGIDAKVREILTYMTNSLMNEEEALKIHNTAIKRAGQLTNSGLTELILLILVVIATVSMASSGVYTGLAEGNVSWMDSSRSDAISLSFAGRWALFVSIPVFQFLLLRWIWRYVVWSILLLRLSKSDLQLKATHSDHAGGLGVLAQAQRNFALIFVAGSIILSGEFCSELLQFPDHFNSIRVVVYAYIIISLVILIFPLTFFAGKLVKIKQQGLLKLSHLSASLSNKFEKEWVNDLPLEKKISENELDPSMLFDYTGIYDSMQQLRPLPLNTRDIIGLGVLIFLPFIPILFIHFSVGELMQKIAGMLL